MPNYLEKHEPEKQKLRDIPILPFIAAVFFVLTFALKAFTDGPYIRGEISSTVAYLKYATALISCVAALFYALDGRETKFITEFNKLMIVAAIFGLVTFTLQLVMNHFSVAGIIELVKFCMPIILAYCILNALNEEQLYHCMVAILVVSWVGYAVELSSQGASFLSFFAADFVSFNSDTESATFSDLSLMLTFYFCYVRRSRVASFASMLMCIMSFKRLAMLVSVLVWVASSLSPTVGSMRISKRVIFTFKVCTIAVVALWFWILLPQNEPLFIQIFGRAPFEFTMGRSTSLRYLLDKNFVSWGFGSTNEVIQHVFGVPFEMDLIKIAIELTPIVMVVFVWLFWDVAGSSIWGFCIVGFFMLNMITSDSLASNFSFSLAYVVIGLVNTGDASAFSNGIEKSCG